MIRVVLTVMLSLATIFPSLLGGVIEFENGDRITAKISGLSGGKLKISNSYAGEIMLDFSQIKNLLADEPLLLVFQNGLKIEAIISLSGNSLKVKGDKNFAVSRGELVSMELPKKQFGKMGLLDNWRGKADFGFNLTKGNTNLTTSVLSFSPERRTKNDHISGFLQSRHAVEARDTKVDLHRGSLRYDRFMNKQLFLFILGEGMRDVKEQLSLRVREGFGFGLNVNRGPNTDFSILGGVTFYQERYAGSDYKSGKEGLVILELETSIFDGLALDQRFQLTKRTSENRYLTQFDSGIHMSLFKSVTLGFRFYDKYDSRPTSATEKNDLGFLSTLGYTF